MSRYLPTVYIVALFACLAWAVDPAPTSEVPGEATARMMKLGEELATPNENHKFLVKMAGDWITNSSIMNLPPESGTASYVMALGNRFLEGKHNGTFAGIQFEGRLILGFDNYKHKFCATFVDNLGTSMRYAEGLLDHSGNVLSLWGTMDEWMTDEHDKPVMYRYRFIDSNHYVFEVHDLSSIGDDTLVIEVQHERLTKK